MPHMPPAGEDRADRFLRGRLMSPASLVLGTVWAQKRELYPFSCKHLAAAAPTKPPAWCETLQ